MCVCAVDAGVVFPPRLTPPLDQIKSKRVQTAASFAHFSGGQNGAKRPALKRHELQVTIPTAYTTATQRVTRKLKQTVRELSAQESLLLAIHPLFLWIHKLSS